MAVDPTRLPELVVADDGTKTAFAFRGVVLGCKDLVIRIAGNADVEFPISGLLINTSDARLSDYRTANAIKTLTSKAIAATADPGNAQALVYSTATGKWELATIVYDGDSRLSDYRTANALKTATAKSISTAADPNQADGLVYDGGVWKPIAVAWANDSRLSDDRTANALRTSASHAIATDAPATGHCLAFQSGNWKSRIRASFQGSAASPTGTSSLTGVMMGVSGTITPSFSGSIIFNISGTIIGAVGGAASRLRYGSGSKPSNGASLTGTPVGGQAGNQASAALPYSLTAVVTGLAIGTAYWLDADLAAVSSGTAYLTNVAIAAHEF